MGCSGGTNAAAPVPPSRSRTCAASVPGGRALFSAVFQRRSVMTLISRLLERFPSDPTCSDEPAAQGLLLCGDCLSRRAPRETDFHAARSSRYLGLKTRANVRRSRSRHAFLGFERFTSHRVPALSARSACGSCAGRRPSSAPEQLAVLQYLALHPGDLAQAGAARFVWGDVAVTDDVVHLSIRSCGALADDHHARFIETAAARLPLHRRNWRHTGTSSRRPCPRATAQRGPGSWSAASVSEPRSPARFAQRRMVDGT